ncbi:hypothetical protein [Rhodococcus opacus]
MSISLTREPPTSFVCTRSAVHVLPHSKPRHATRQRHHGTTISVDAGMFG